MNKFKRIALEVAEELKKIGKENQKKVNLVDLWKEKCKDSGFKESLIKKGCPRLTFIGLCENNMIHGISVKNSYKESVNKNYGSLAVKILKENKDRKYTPKELWDAIGNKDKSYNYQMHIVLILWDKKLIV